MSKPDGELETPSLFLCHSSVDKKFVRQLAISLTKLGARVWIDEAELRVGDSLIRTIGNAILDADYVAVVLSATSIDSPWVDRELRLALHQEFKDSRVIVLPILIQDVALPPFLRDKLYADFTDIAKYEDALASLWRAITRERRNHPRVLPDVKPRSTSGGFQKDLRAALTTLGHKALYFAPGIPPKVLRNAITTCEAPNDSTVFCVFDCAKSWDTAASTAVLLTDDGIYFGGQTPRNAIVRIFVSFDRLYALNVYVKLEKEWRPPHPSVFPFPHVQCTLIVGNDEIEISDRRTDPFVLERAIRIIERVVSEHSAHLR